MRSLSLLLLGAGTLLGAAPVRAQAPATQPPAAQQPRTGRQADRPGDVGPGGRRGRGGPGDRRLGARGALRGITLTDAQRTQLRAVADKYRTERRTLHDQTRAQFGAGRGQGTPRANGQGAAVARPDSAARAAFRTRARDLQQRQLADVRAVLTPDQRTTFDRNVTELRTRAAQFEQRGGRGRAGRGADRGVTRGTTRGADTQR